MNGFIGRRNICLVYVYLFVVGTYMISDMYIQIRQERPEDYQQIRELVRNAFALAEHSDGEEHNLIERMRLSPEYIPELSLVAVSGDIILGHIMFSKISVGQSEAIALAPISVRTDRQRKGIGKLLVTTGHKLARKMGYRCSMVLGNPDYYSKFGYERASSYGIIASFDVPDEYYRVCDLGNTGDLPKGYVRYSDAFEL